MRPLRRNKETSGGARFLAGRQLVSGYWAAVAPSAPAANDSHGFVSRTFPWERLGWTELVVVLCREAVFGAAAFRRFGALMRCAGIQALRKTPMTREAFQ